MRHRYTNQEMIGYIKEFAALNGHPPSNIEWDKNRSRHQPSSRSYRLRFGGWLPALQLAGLVVDRSRFLERWNQSSIIEALQRFARENNRPPNSRDLTGDMPSHESIRLHFGSVRNALAQSGLHGRPCSYSDAEVVEHLRTLFQKLGRVPTRREIDDGLGFQGPTTSVISRRYGSLSKAFVAARLPGARLVRVKHLVGNILNKLSIRVLSPKAMESRP